MAGRKLPHSVVDERVETCYNKRYSSNETFTITDWIAFCHETYNDKSEQQYTDYWMKASNLYKDYWREKLEAHLDPAVNTILELLGSEDEKVRQKAVEQVFKYTGNDIQKIEADIRGQVSIQLNWGTDPGLQKLESE